MEAKDRIISALDFSIESVVRDFASWYWYTSLLSGPKTQIRNILGSVSNITFNTMARPAAVASDWFVGLFGKGSGSMALSKRSYA